MLNRIQNNLPIAIRHGVIIPLGVMVPAFLLFGDDPIQGALAACAITGVFAAIMLCMLIVDGVCYHFNVWERVTRTLSDFVGLPDYDALLEDFIQEEEEHEETRRMLRRAQRQVRDLEAEVVRATIAADNWRHPACVARQ